MACLLVQRGRHLRWRHAIGHKLADFLHFFVRVVDVEKSRRVTQVQGGLLVLLFQDLQDAQVAADFLHLRGGEQIEDLRFLRLAIAIDAPVALLKDHQRPWQVKVYESVAEVMEIQALGRHVRTEQQPQRILPAPEALDDLLLRGIGKLAMHERDLLVVQAQIALQLTMQPAQGLEALGEHDQRGPPDCSRPTRTRQT